MPGIHETLPTPVPVALEWAAHLNIRSRCGSDSFIAGINNGEARFACEICKKGFPREQNLQLHRRSHNLPWKLKQSAAGKPKRRRLYICPETTCARHHPSRALGDLTGIKKHFHRKHGEKVFRCERCGKKYATDCDWKAHSKTCGTREYHCLCGTLFSRKDSLNMHRAYCDAIADEMGNKGAAPPSTAESSSSLPASTGVLSPGLSFHSADMGGNQSGGRKRQKGTVESFSSSSSSSSSQLFPWPGPFREDLSCYGGCPRPAACLSATSLLQKAAQFGPSSPPCSFVAGSTLTSLLPSPSLSSGPGLGLEHFRCDDESDLPVAEMIFAANPPPLDFL
ncbi:unnamed protein product [Cuscuta campestris]|uniref:C2H2-type domain-containing protein n=1 Tax=Cuscuta campestris TaxID=132261 RepID=A0A484NR31_9ASTE|nr:unnamed protein product [Cuscuta campestris]